MSSELLTHLDADGRARMVDVGAKPETDRVATARAVVRMSPQTATAVAAGDAPKGDVIGTARLAAIQAAKRTDEWIPLCHTLPLNSFDVEIDVDSGDRHGDRDHHRARTRPYGRRDGGDGRRRCRRTDHLRHGQGD